MIMMMKVMIMMMMIIINNINLLSKEWLTSVAQWQKYCTTNQKVAGSIPDGVTEFFIDINPSDRTMEIGVDSASNRNKYQEYILG
jgi:hypothetical protein